MMNTANNTLNYEFDPISRHYIVRNTRVLFANFSGVARQYNNEGRRNFHIVIPDELADEMEARGVNVHTLKPRNEGDEVTKTLKISVYENAKINLLRGRDVVEVVVSSDKNLDMAPMVDQEFAQGHVLNGYVDIEFHIANNTRVPNSSPYLRVDVMYLPVRKSKLAEEYENYMKNDVFDDDEDDDLPM